MLECCYIFKYRIESTQLRATDIRLLSSQPTLNLKETNSIDDAVCMLCLCRVTVN